MLWAIRTKDMVEFGDRVWGVAIFSCPRRYAVAEPALCTDAIESSSHYIWLAIDLMAILVSSSYVNKLLSIGIQQLYSLKYPDLQQLSPITSRRGYAKERTILNS